MSVTTILLIALAALLALGFVVFKYFLGNKNRSTSTWLLAAFRFLSVFIILLLLINPTIKQLELEVVKPDLFLAVDQSASIRHLEVNDSVRDLASSLQNHPELNERFNVQLYGFGRDINRIESDTFSFEKQQSNISMALKGLSKLSTGKSAILLLSDGNQTVGEDFQYFNPGNSVSVFPVVTGDTTAQEDLSITRLNVNKYAFLNNQFPVETIVNYSGDENVRTTFSIKAGNSVVFSKEFNFDSENRSAVVTTNLPASGLGTRIYEVEITPLDDEKNKVNNSYRFGIEVIDERTTVLILSAISHPDLGMFKKSIEQNEQREATIEYITNLDKINLSDFQLVILYQPNNRFKVAIEKIEELNLNFLLVTGTETDWNFVNNIQGDFVKDISGQTQEFFPVYNPNYSRFQFEDIGFENYPPLLGIFGSLTFTANGADFLLYQQLEGIETDAPLLATYEDGEQVKRGVLFGEGIWKWRAQSFVEYGSFEEFDNFIGKLTQFLSATQKRDRLTFEAEPFYPENEEVVISARYYDETYTFDPEGELKIQLKNKNTDGVLEAQLLLNNNRYEVSLDNLEPGDYNFTINEENSGLSRSGSFSIIEYNIEQQFSSANLSKMKFLAENNSSPLYFLNQSEEIVEGLLQDDRFIPIQKSHEKTVPLISWKFLLILLVLSLSAEWFTRKYFGLI